MANFKVNEVVRVKATGQTGIIKAREVSNVGDKRIKVEYVVRLGEGFNNWKSFDKKDLEKIAKTQEKVKTVHKFYEMTGEYEDYILCMVAETKIEKSYQWNGDKCSVVITRNKDLYMGYSIFNPDDVFDEEKGIKIALHRLKDKPFVKMSSSFAGEFNNATIDAIMDVKAKYIIDNADKFITKPFEMA